MKPDGVDLSTTVGDLQLRNPVLTASGTFGYGSEFAPFFDLRGIGGFVSKSLTVEARSGHDSPRIAETPAGMLNAIGLENVGVDAFIREKLPLIPQEVPVIASVFGTELSAYAEVCKRLQGVEQVVALEINASCPHVKSGGMEFGQNPQVLAELVRVTRQASDLPLWVKLSPNVTDIGALARVCEGEGANAISLINSLQALEVDVDQCRPVLRNGIGGLTGPAIRPVALRMVWQASQAVQIPICGMGGIQSAEDVVAFLLCGASAVQLGTVNFLNPRAAIEIVAGLHRYAERHQLEKISDLIGALEFPAKP